MGGVLVLARCYAKGVPDRGFGWQRSVIDRNPRTVHRSTPPPEQETDRQDELDQNA
ncbi:MAG: hypothetical protein ACKVP1_03270 [Burkholderiaceae bacterium]